MSKAPHFLKTTFANRPRAILTIFGIFVCIVILTFLLVRIESLHKETTLQYAELPRDVAFLSGQIYDEEIADFSSVYADIDVIKFRLTDRGTVRGMDKLAVNAIGVPNDFLSRYILDLSSSVGAYMSELACGRLFTESERLGLENAVILNESSALLLFGKENPLGQIVQTESESRTVKDHKVVGVIRDSYFTSRAYRNYREAKTNAYKINFYVPSAEERSSDTAYQNVILCGRGKDISSFVQSGAFFGNEHSPFLKSKFDTYTYAQMRSIVQESMQFFKKYVSLIGIVIACEGLTIILFMIFAIKERVGEIGIRKALGATGFDIAVQFIFEYQILNLIGTAAGMLTGVFISGIVKLADFAATGFIVFVNVAPVLALVAACSVTVVLLLSLIPAWIAQRVKIADSLRFV